MNPTEPQLTASFVSEASSADLSINEEILLIMRRLEQGEDSPQGIRLSPREVKLLLQSLRNSQAAVRATRTILRQFTAPFRLSELDVE